MTVFCLGSINADFFYTLPHLPAAGETLSARAHHKGLGGKGANQSVAAAKAGSRAVHIGAVGPDGAWAVNRLKGYGVETAVRSVDEATGHAIIMVDEGGENSIILYPGANHEQAISAVTETLLTANEGDILLLQNETDLQADTAELARSRGLRVVYSAAPFGVDAVRAVLPFIDILILNEVEERQLIDALGALPKVPGLLVTKGAEGALWRDDQGAEIHVPAQKVTPVDTTGAGDTFAGYFAAGLDQGLGPEAAMRRAAAAAALKVTRKGTADAIPSADEVAAFQE